MGVFLVESEPVSKMLKQSLLSCILLTFIFNSQSLAQDLDDKQIIEKLSKVRTRSLAPPKRPTPDELEILKVLQTRGLSYSEGARRKINSAYDIVAEYNYPKLSFAIEFAFGSADINQESRPQLISLSKALKSDSFIGAQFVLAGHTDAKGDDEFNLMLSRKRANSVLKFLTEGFGVSTQVLSAVGLGETKLKNSVNPLADENRRVEVINLSFHKGE